MGQQIYNIRGGESFVDVLAEIFLRKYQNKPAELSQITFLLPTRRACQSLNEAFVRQRGCQPTILPQILPIADVEEDEVLITGDGSILQELEPAVDKTERTLIFTRLILQSPKALGLEDLSLAQAYALAENLGELIDMTENENLSFSRLPELVSAEYAVHWEKILKLLTIITDNWPKILAERGLSDVSARRNMLLRAELKIWQQAKKRQKVIIAGTTAAYPLLKELVKTVLNMPDGEVYLYGLDNCLSDSAWAKIDENHPQFELKELLDYLNVNRGEVINLPQNILTERERFVAEIMRPAATSDDWRNICANPFSDAAFTGLSLVNCDDIRQEAQAIALIIRNVLQTPEKTVALVTYDRNLSRRVVSELKRWNITADDSAGQPLHLTPIGIYLCLIQNVLEQNFSQSSLLALLKHPFTACGMSYNECNTNIRNLELQWRKQEQLDDERIAFLQKIQNYLQPLVDLYNSPQVDLQTMFEQHVRVAERLADTDIKTGEKIIWKGDAGACAAKFVSDFIGKCRILENIKTNEYTAFFSNLLAQQNVRVRYGMHPRVKILGPIEARLSQYDVTILGEVNEGSWPKMPTSDLWMSRQMRRDFGLPLPERMIGVTAADFAHLLQGKEVYLTRAERLDGTPTGKSRWWLRLETVLAANFGDNKAAYAFLYDAKYSFWAKHLERAKDLKPITPPHPCPDIGKRPRKLSASNIEMLMRDPYTIFAKYVLNLYPLHKLDEDKTTRDFGNIVHKVMERFNGIHNNGAYPDDAFAELCKLGEEEFTKAGIPEVQKAFWLPKFIKAINWIVATEQKYRHDISTIHNEIEGQITLDFPNGPFSVTAKADRIDETVLGELNIIDYKSGKARSEKDMMSGKAPQLPIEGLIAVNGGYDGIKKKEIASLRYWSTKGKEVVCSGENAHIALENTEETLRSLILRFDSPLMPYLAKPNPHNAPAFSDYDHLSRLLEWSVRDEENDNDE
jgi:ATP-dependent helicase/nuclease subunit B